MVQLISTLALFAATLNGVHAFCYDSGPIWCENPPADVQQHILNACWGYTNENGPQRGAFQFLHFKSHGDSGLPATVCVNIGCNKKLVMQVTNLTSKERDLTGRQCEAGLLGQAMGCMTGGENDQDGWHFRAAPEYGQC